MANRQVPKFSLNNCAQSPKKTFMCPKFCTNPGLMYTKCHISTNLSSFLKLCLQEVESSRTSLASRTHFQVLGLGLEALGPRKLLCPRLEDSNIFLTVEILLENARNLAENLQIPFLFSTIGALA